MFPNSANRTPRRIPLADSRTASPRPLPSWCSTPSRLFSIDECVILSCRCQQSKILSFLGFVPLQGPSYRQSTDGFAITSKVMPNGNRIAHSVTDSSRAIRQTRLFRSRTSHAAHSAGQCLEHRASEWLEARTFERPKWFECLGSSTCKQVSDSIRSLSLP
jgi:hypothetical protein